MLLQNSFRLPVPVEQAWATLLDVPRIAPCLPGAVLDEFHGTTHRGRMQVTIGPIQRACRDEATIAEQDQAARKLVLVASGKETRGGGAASVRVVADLVQRNGATDLQVATELDLTGKPAQFGRSIVSGVRGRLIDEFAANLAARMSAPDTATTRTATASAAGPVAQASAPASAPAPAAPAEGAALDVWTLVPAPVRVGFRIGLPTVLLVALGWAIGRRRR